MIMKTHNTMRKKWVRLASGLVTVAFLSLSFSGQAAARIIFEDDTYFNIQSEGIIIDANDNKSLGTLSSGTYTMADAACLNGETYTATINGTAVVYTATTADCAGADSADTAAVLQGLTAAIDADYTVGHIVDAVYSANTITVTATVADPSNNYTTTASDTSAAGNLQATAGTLAGGVLGDTIQLQFGNDGTDALISYDPNNQNLTLSAPGGTFDFTNDDIRTTGALEFQGSSEFHIREVTNEASAACTTPGEVVLDTTENRIYVCTATGTPGTWTASDSGSSQDFDDVYDISQSNANLTMEIDNGTLNFNITTADSFAIQDGGTNIAEFTGAGAVNFDPTSGQNFDVTTTGVGDILFTASDTFDVDAVGAVGIDSDATVTIGGASIGITADGGILSLTGDGTNDIDILNTGAAIDIDAATLDALLTGAFSIDGVGASNVTTDSGNLTLSTTTSGDVDITGATNVDVVSTTGDITLTAGDDIIFDDAQLTGTVQLSVTATDWAVVFPTDGIIDNINAFTTTNNGEGASLVGIEDVGTYFTSTNVEGALQELGLAASKEVEDLTFYPEYPDMVVYQDGSNNRGTLESFYDNTQDTSYYNWTTNLATQQDINIQFHFVLPPDYNAIGTNGLQFAYRTGTATTTSNKVDVIMSEVVSPGSVTQCGSSLTNANGTGAGGAFATGQITKATIEGSCTLAAGDLILVEIILYDDTGAADFADVGYITLDYDN